METLLGLSAAMSLHREVYLRRALEAGCRLLEARYGALAVLDESGGYRHWLTHGLEPDTERAIGAPPTGRGILGRILAPGRVVRLDDVASHPDAAGFPSHHPVMGPFIGTSIAAEGRTFGRLYFANVRGARGFTRRDELLLGAVAALVAAAVEASDNVAGLEEAQQRLIVAEQKAMVAKVSRALAHEMRHPLAIVRNVAFLLKQRLDQADAPGTRAVHMLGEQVDALNAHLSALLEFAEPPQLSPEQLSLPGLFREVFDVHPPPKGVRVRTRWAPLLAVVGDGRRLVSAFSKIVDNAYEAMPRGGELAVRARIRDGRVVIDLRDTGTGIAPEDVDRIFEPLFTTKAFGLGLGLSIADAIIRAHGGRIEVQSAPACGTRVLIELPGDGPRNGHSPGKG